MNALNKTTEEQENKRIDEFINMNDPYRNKTMTQGRNLYAGSNTIDHQSDAYHHNPRTSMRVRRSNTMLGSL